MWDRVEELVVRAPSSGAVHHHQLNAVAARARRRRGLPVEPQQRAAEQAAAIAALSSVYLLGRVRAAVDGPLVLMKGPEVAASYPQPQTRLFKDLDILTPDVDAAYRALLAAGFVEVTCGSFVPPPYHCWPLGWPGVPLTIELHRAPRGVPDVPVPSFETLLALTQPSRTGVEGVLGLVPSAHAVVLAVHAWSHGPLERLGPLIDVAAVLGDGDRAAADAHARTWGCERLWRTTVSVIDALLMDGSRTIAARTWARHLFGAREPSVLESHLSRVAAAAWGLPHSQAGRGVGREIKKTALVYGEDSWPEKLHRARRAVRHAVMPLSDYRALPTTGEEPR
jgi:putative nucleotidyltransferase-like protein